jgi:hypothetical protein
MSKEANYSEFKDLPANWSRAVWGPKPEKGDAKLINDADPFKWSGDKDPPAIGEKVKVYMNGFGPGTVTSYFVEYGWLGVLVKFDKPPKWWVKQTKDSGKDPKTTCGHCFGLDLQQRKIPVEAL